ncbi:MAG: hypothetical protein ACI3XA_00555 [Clostridia bacterium]
MFKDVYKSANDCIKGDREILDKAFLQAAQPEKTSSPIWKFSALGTAVVAVVVAGAIFMNSELFLEKGKDIKPVGEDDSVITQEKSERIMSEKEDISALEDKAAVLANDLVSDENEAENNINLPEFSNTSDGDLSVTKENQTEKGKSTAETKPDTSSIAVGSTNVSGANSAEKQEPKSVISEDTPETNNEAAVFSNRRSVEDEAENITAEVGVATMSFFEEDEVVNENDEDAGLMVSSYMPKTEETSAYDEDDAWDESENVITEDEAVEVAKSVCTVEYDNIDVSYDNETRLWRITFLKNDTVGGCQTVFVEFSGAVTDIVYGE